MKKIAFTFIISFVFLAWFYQSAEKICFADWCMPVIYLIFSKVIIMLLAVFLVRRFIKLSSGFLSKGYGRITYPLIFSYLIIVFLVLIFFNHSHLLSVLNRLPMLLAIVSVVEISFYVRRMLDTGYRLIN